MNVTKKICGGCRKRKPYRDFEYVGTTKDGYSAKCRVCVEAGAPVRGRGDWQPVSKVRIRCDVCGQYYGARRGRPRLQMLSAKDLHKCPGSNTIPDPASPVWPDLKSIIPGDAR